MSSCNSALLTHAAWQTMIVVCDYSLHVAVTWWTEAVGKEMEILTRDFGTVGCILTAISR